LVTPAEFSHQTKIESRMTQPDITNSPLPALSSSDAPTAANTSQDATSDRLLGNFISLFDTIEAVARRVTGWRRAAAVPQKPLSAGKNSVSLTVSRAT